MVDGSRDENLHDHMNFVAWMDRCIFPDDLAEDLERHGLPKTYARAKCLDFRDQNRKGEFKIMKLWQDYCVGANKKNNELTDALFKVVKEYYAKWLTYK